MPESIPVRTDEPRPAEWLTTAEAAEHSGYSVWWVRQLIANGEIKAHRRPGGVRSHWRIRREDLDAFLAGGGSS